VSPSYFTRLVGLSYLAPDIAQAIFRDRGAAAWNQDRSKRPVSHPMTALRKGEA
jgi:hypothetical protein